MITVNYGSGKAVTLDTAAEGPSSMASNGGHVFGEPIKMHEPTIWAVALNSEAARILPGIRRDGRVAADEIALHGVHARLQDLMADRPGRSYESVGSRRSAMEYASDPVREVHRAFLRSVLARLQAARGEGAFDQLAIFASRRMLGMFREEAPPELAALVVCEVAKNLLHLSPTALARTVAQAVFSGPDIASP